MKHETNYDMMCPKFEGAFKILGKRWNALIIRTLLGGEHRFSELHAVIPALSDRMLSERLRELEIEGIVLRKVFVEIPVRIEYSLSIKGKSLKPALEEIQRWAETWHQQSN